MKTEADRLKRWREQKKAEGKTSLTVLLSPEARLILTEEKKKTGESFAVIIDRALQALKQQTGRPSVPKYFPKRDAALTRLTTDQQPSATPVLSTRDNGEPPSRLLIDDLDKQADLWNMDRNHGETNNNQIYKIKTSEGFITRLFRFSQDSSFKRRKKWFK